MPTYGIKQISHQNYFSHSQILNGAICPPSSYSHYINIYNITKNYAVTIVYLDCVFICNKNINHPGEGCTFV